MPADPSPPEAAAPDDEFEFGPAWSGNRCCGKPVGCTNTTSGCRMRNHPWKRRVLGTGGLREQ